MKKTLLLMLMIAGTALADVPWVEESITAAWDVQLQLRNDYAYAPIRVRPEIKSIIAEFLRLDLEMDLSRSKEEQIPTKNLELYATGLQRLAARLQNLPKEQAQLADVWIQTVEDLQYQLLDLKPAKKQAKGK